MTSVIKSNVRGEVDNKGIDVPAQDAQNNPPSKRGDRNAAKSSPLMSKNIQADDPKMSNEKYILAKADGNVSEASRHFAQLFSTFFFNEEINTQDQRNAHRNEFT